MRPVRYNGAARAELDHAADVTEVARAGYGARLRDAVRRTTDLIAGQPGVGAKVRGSPARRLVVPGFSYSVVYLDTPTAIVVYALPHHKRRPRYWFDRLPTPPGGPTA